MTESIANLTGYRIHLNRRHVYIFLIHHLKHRYFFIVSFFQSSYSSDRFPYTLWRTPSTVNLVLSFRYTQWRTQEFCSVGGVQQIQLRIEDRENGDLGAVAPPSQGFWRQL